MSDDPRDEPSWARRQHGVTYLVWALLGIAAGGSAWVGNWATAFVALATFALTLLPILAQDWTGVRLPAGFVGAVAVFIVGTLFLGEVGDFYERFWWWDVLMHSGSAVGFGMIGTVLVLLIVRGDRLRAPPFLGGLLAFTFAVAIGALWEIFEYTMDQVFGLNMQKSGLRDTMWDLIVDCVGGLVGALAGYGYLRGRGGGRLARVIARFVEDNLHRRDGA
ncbi:hypothetical protein [Salinarimonas rosea]|uniref:hypothetical protein n=1 Tax=Salinarimonas rosea TaxID=552063 RepID=UPI000693B654|nr:hypothetical protein [Salinarimonas rosea]